MRELREFRAHHDAFVAAGVAVAGVSRDSVDSSRHWARRLAIPYPLLSDRDGAVSRSLGVVRRIGVGSWTVELMRRATLLAGADGRVVAAWANVKVRGHAQAVLEVARVIGTIPAP